MEDAFGAGDDAFAHLRQSGRGRRRLSGRLDLILLQPERGDGETGRRRASVRSELHSQDAGRLEEEEPRGGESTARFVSANGFWGLFAVAGHPVGVLVTMLTRATARMPDVRLCGVLRVRASPGSSTCPVERPRSAPPWPEALRGEKNSLSPHD